MAALGFTTKVADPGTIPTGDGNGIAFSPDGAFVAIAHATSPRISVYPWDGATLGTKVADPATLPAGDGIGVSWSPDGAFVAVAHSTSPGISVYAWSLAGFGAKVADPATLPVNGTGVAWSPNGAWIAVSHLATPFISIYPWSGGAFGAKVADPAALPAGAGNAVAWSPDGLFVAVAHSTSPFVSVYPWSGAFGTKVGNPTNLPGGTGNAVAFSPDGTAIGVGATSSVRLNVYPWSGAGFGTRYSLPVTVPSGSIRGIAFSRGSDFVATASLNSPIVHVYPWAAGFGTKVADPAIIPNGFGLGVAFSPASGVGVAHAGSSPRMTVYAEIDHVAGAASASASGAAFNPTITTDLGNAAPGIASATGAARAPSASVFAHAGVATATAAAGSPTVVSGIVVRPPPIRLAFHSNAFAMTGTASATSPVDIYLGGFKVDDRVKWSAKTEEILGGVGSALIEIDPIGLDGVIDEDFDPEPHEEVFIKVRATGWVLFHGESQTPTFKIYPDLPFPRWSIPCRDFNGQLSERLVGAPDGNQFWRPNDKTPWQAIDADAISGGNDQVTVRNWFDAYFRFPSGMPARTTTYVGQYVDGGFLGAEENIMWLYDATTDLQSVLATLASAADVNVQGWLRPDGEFVWAEIPRWQDMTAGGSTGDLPAAPVSLGIGGTPIRLEGSGTKDGQAMPQAVYLQGNSGYHLDPVTGNVISGGSGWYPSKPGKNQRQAYLAAPGSWTEASKNRIGASAMRRAADNTLRLSLIVIEANMGGFRAGMYVAVTEPVLPRSMRDGSDTGIFPIQRVETTFLMGSNHFNTAIDVGDGPAGSINGFATRDWNIYHPKLPTGANAQAPIRDYPAEWSDFGWIDHGQERDVVFSPKGPRGEPWGPPGILFEFEVEARDRDGVLVPDEGTCDPPETRSDRDGKIRTTMHSSDTRDDLYYVVNVFTNVLPAV